MAKTPLDFLFDHIEWRCTKCGQPECDCWIMIRCPCCGTQKHAERHETDPQGTAVVIYPCPKCGGKTYQGEVEYLDRIGRKIKV